MKVAVVGATGLVGSKMLEVLAERNFPLTEILPVASAKSTGTEIDFAGKKVKVISAEDAIRQKPRFAIFSAGSSPSLELAPKFAAGGTTVIDNSSAWRMNAEVPLIVPEINGDVLKSSDRIIANPNCSTIQLVMVLNPLHKKFHVKRVVVSTYQSVSGTGKKAMQQLMDERAGKNAERVYPHAIDLNCIPQVDVFLENDFTKEEIKMTNETKKILRDESLQINATCVRIPVKGGHSESVNIEFENDFEISEVKKILSNTEGVILQDEPASSGYPMPLHAEGSDLVFVGRIRKDFTQPKSLNCWIVSDNLRKGAATNAVQIAEYCLNKFGA